MIGERRPLRTRLIRRLALLLLGGLIFVRSLPASGQGSAARRVNAPYFDGEVLRWNTAIFWFGRVTPTENYVDVRVGYNDHHVYVRLATFDRRLWYDRSPSPDDLTAWDGATVYLRLDDAIGDALGADCYRFEAQLTWWGPRESHQASYRGDSGNWAMATVPFTTTSSWRGSAPNDDADDRGWVLEYVIPFDSLGLDGPSPQRTAWSLALGLHDRDDAEGTPMADKVWPEAMEPRQPSTWGHLVFGMPVYGPPFVIPVETLTIRHGLDGSIVSDADVGGSSTCGEGIDFWTEWGETNYAGKGFLNIQNQGDVADWPCYSKYYITFPLDDLQPDRVVLSATLTLHKFGQAGAPGQAYPSLIQVLTVAEDWDEATLTWNNAPLAVENVAATRVEPVPDPGWPGTPFTWDVTGAVAEAHAAGEPLRLALYSADTAYHSGKYFVSSDSTIQEGRPTLRISMGAPLAAIRKQVHPAAPGAGQMVTYTLTLLGSGQVLTITDNLPAQVSAPGPIQVSGGPAASYEQATHRLSWTGSPGVGQPVSVTFPVTLLVAGPLAVENTAVLTKSEAAISTDTAVFIAGARRLWLPAVLRGR